MRARHRLGAVGALFLVASAHADFTRNILLTGYWPPTNEMLRPWSTNPDQNPGEWIGGNWEGRGYDIHSYFPEFPDGLGRGVGDLEVDYQDTSEDFWRIANDLKPIAIITFSRGDRRNNPRWEIEWRQRNLENWIDDYDAPFQPTPSPPDDSVPADYIRYSSLPMDAIREAVNASEIGVNAYVDETDFGGGFLSEFMAYHGTWYHDIHSDPSDEAWNIAAGHIHVSFPFDVDLARQTTEITLRVLTEHLDLAIPEPATGMLMMLGLLGLARRLTR